MVSELNNTLLQLVPSLPPRIDGLGDHAHALAAALLAHHGIASRFLVSDPTWITMGGPQREPRGIPFVPGNAVDLNCALNTHANDGTVLLHYVGYAYDPHQGRPHWLVDGLERWRRAQPERRLITMFHELFASGPPWRKAFWLSAGQQRVTAALARLSDATFTSNACYATWLARHLPDHQPCPIWPVLSNIGEPDNLSPFNQRPPSLALFGRAMNRARAYQRGGKALSALCARLGITEVHDLGAPLPGKAVPDIAGLTVHLHGVLPASDVSRVLRACRIGYLDNATGRLSKSGVFAAYASHGVVPVVEGHYPDEDQLVRNEHLVALTAPPVAERFPHIASNAHAWYYGHAAPALSRFVADTMARLRSTIIAH